jgi:RimJ/RimL family protein N-acetyltransferase
LLSDGFEVGWILRRIFWRRGYATEGARASLRCAFDELKQSHVISVIHPENRSSIRVAEKLGERLEGRTEVFGVEVLVSGIDRETVRGA